MTQPPPRTPAKRKARELAKHLRGERPDYAYLKDVFRHLRAELDVEVQREPKALPYVPTEAEIRRYYQTVWAERRGGDIILIKTLLYTGRARLLHSLDAAAALRGRRALAGRPIRLRQNRLFGRGWLPLRHRAQVSTATADTFWIACAKGIPPTPTARAPPLLRCNRLLSGEPGARSVLPL
jgi:hypothetical protein